MKTVLKALIAATTLFSPLFADLCPEEQCCGTRVQGPSGPCCSVDGDLYFAVDFLWWKACLTDMDYAVSFNNSNLGSNGVASIGTYQNMDHHWAPAFRVQGGLLNGWCGLDFLVRYTFYRDVETYYTAVPSGGLLQSTLIANVGLPYTLTNLTTEHNLRYQTIDFLFGKEIYACNCHTLTPFIGIQGLKLDQDWLQKFSGVSVGGTGFNSSFVRLDSTVEALGLEAGTVWDWRPLDSFSLFTKAAFSILAGKQDGRFHQVYADAGIPINSNITRHYLSCDCIPGIQLAFGASYITRCMEREFILSVGYEFNEWFNLSQIGHYPSAGPDLTISSDSVNNSRVVLHGLFVRFGFEL